MAKHRFVGVIPRQVTLYGQEARPQPPMGMAYASNGVVAAGWEPVLIDACAEGYDVIEEDESAGYRATGYHDSAVIDRIRKANPDAIGVSMGLSTDQDFTKQLIHSIKKEFPQIPLIVGGSHASLMNERLFNGYYIEQVDADYVVTGRDIGSGELSTQYLLGELDGRRNYGESPGVLYRNKGRHFQTEAAPVRREELERLALPLREIFSVKNGLDIYSAINRSHTGPVDETPYAVMHTSRGCGGACTFCHQVYAGFDRTLIGRSLDNIIIELEHLKDKGCKTISIEDDNFGGFQTSRTELAGRILEKIQEYDFKGVYFPNGLTLRSMINNNHLLLRQLRKMADSGMKIRNSLPFESGDSSTLSGIINKPHNIQDIEAVLEEVKKGYLGHPNLELDAFFMVGAVGYDRRRNSFVRETNESIQRTIDLARKVSDLGILVNVWWMKPNPAGPQYVLWRDKNPEKPFYELQFLFPSGIWSNPEKEKRLNEKIREINKEMSQKGTGSKRPIYPVDNMK